jgi:hypothetical protein
LNEGDGGRDGISDGRSGEERDAKSGDFEPRGDGLINFCGVDVCMAGVICSCIENGGGDAGTPREVAEEEGGGELEDGGRERGLRTDSSTENIVRGMQDRTDT